MNKIKNRVLLSLDGGCPYHCNHCYTYELPHVETRSINEIVASVADEQFDIAYVSQKIENFANPDDGLKLCEQLFQTYHCHLMIITRNILKSTHFERMLRLHMEMKKRGKMLFLASSVIGMESAQRSEQLSLIPDTLDRLDFIKSAYCAGIPAMVLIRPLFPSIIIPSSEIERIVDYVSGKVSCIVTGPLMVNEPILNRLGLSESSLTYIEGGESEYLNGAMRESMKFVNVLPEIKHLREYCAKKQLMFFEHSMPAVNYLYSLQATLP